MCHEVFYSMCHPKTQVPSVELGFSGLSSGNAERSRRILQHTWRLITVCIVLISFRISFPIGNLELKTSACDSLVWCWDLFRQQGAACVVQGGGGIAVAGVCALDLMLFCPNSRMGIALHLQYLSTTAPVMLRGYYLQPCNLSPKLLWQHISELLKQWFSLVGLMLLSVFRLFSWLCPWQTQILAWWGFAENNYHWCETDTLFPLFFTSHFVDFYFTLEKTKI